YVLLSARQHVPPAVARITARVRLGRLKVRRDVLPDQRQYGALHVRRDLVSLPWDGEAGERAERARLHRDLQLARDGKCALKVRLRLLFELGELAFGLLLSQRWWLGNSFRLGPGLALRLAFCGFLFLGFVRL